MKRILLSTIAFLTLVSCASTSVIPVSQSQFILNTSAAPACGSAGAARVATQMAAVETIRAGYEAFTIVGAGSSNDVQVIQSAPTGAITNSTFNAYGNTLYGQSNTTLIGGGPIILGGYDQQLAVQMYRRGEPGFANAINARNSLGPDWQTIVTEGVRTCS